MPELLVPPTQMGVALALEFVPPTQILHDLLDRTVVNFLDRIRSKGKCSSSSHRTIGAAKQKENKK